MNLILGVTIFPFKSHPLSHLRFIGPQHHAMAAPRAAPLSRKSGPAADAEVLLFAFLVSYGLRSLSNTKFICISRWVNKALIRYSMDPHCGCRRKAGSREEQGEIRNKAMWVWGQYSYLLMVLTHTSPHQTTFPTSHWRLACDYWSYWKVSCIWRDWSPSDECLILVYQSDLSLIRGEGRFAFWGFLTKKKWVWWRPHGVPPLGAAKEPSKEVLSSSTCLRQRAVTFRRPFFWGVKKADSQNMESTGAQSQWIEDLLGS